VIAMTARAYSTNREIFEMTRIKRLLLAAIALPLAISAAHAAARVDPDELRNFTDMSVGEVLTILVSEDRTAAQEFPVSTEDSWAMLPPL
jgi:hypothetical protein